MSYLVINTGRVEQVPAYKYDEEGKVVKNEHGLVMVMNRVMRPTWEMLEEFTQHAQAVDFAEKEQTELNRIRIIRAEFIFGNQGQ